MRTLSVVFASLLLSSAVSAQAPRIVRSTGPGAWGSVRLVEDLRIGQLEGEEAYTFGIIAAVAPGRDGSLWVAEATPLQIRIYDSKGRYTRTVGREGDGPGEFRQITAVHPLAGGGLAVLDGRLGRISVFDASGEFKTSHRFPVMLFTNDMFKVDPAGNYYVKANARPFRPDDFGIDKPMVWIKVTPDGQVADSIPIPQGPEQSVQSYGGPYSSRTPSMIASLSPLGYFVTGNPQKYSFDINQPGGRTLRIQREHRPLSLSRGERSEWEAMAEYLTSQPGGMMLRMVKGKPDTLKGPTIHYRAPAQKPAFRAISFDADGTIWIERYVAAEQRPAPKNPPTGNRPQLRWYEPHTFDLYEPTGKFLGTIVAPTRVSLEARQGMTVYGILRGEFDEQYVVRYRIERSGR